MDKKNKNNIAKILLAFGVLASPMMLANQVSADNSIANTTNTNNVDATATAQSDAVTTENVIKENKENEEQAKEVVNSAAEKAATEATKEATTKENTATGETEATSQKEEKSDENTKVVENKEEVDFKLDASQKHELKEAGYTDAEIEAIENSIKKSLAENPDFDVNAFVTSKVNEKKSVNEEYKLEMSDEAKTEAVAAGEATEAKDISNEVQSKYVALTEEGHETKGTVKPDSGEAIGWEVSFTSPKGTIAGDYFTIDLSDNLSLKGIEPDNENEYPIEIDGKVVADGVRTDRSTIKYTFNENINDQRNVVVSVKGFAYIDKTKVPNNTENEKISIKLGDTVDEHNIKVEYGDPYYTGNNLNGMSQFTEFNPKTGEFTQVFYINPDSKTITTSNRNWATGKVAMFIDGLTPDKTPSDVNYTKENTKVSIQKLPAGTEVPDAIIENPVKTDEPTMVKTTFRDGGIEITFAENGDDKLRHDNIDSPYIVTVTSTAAPSKTGNNVYSRATLYGDGTRFHIMDNNIVTTVGDTEAQGEKIGYFKEHHVYYTKVDGVLQEDKTFTLHSNKTEGHDYDKYFTSKNVIDDFKFIKVDTDRLVENPVYNEDGTIARGNYEPGKTKEVTYIYERDITSGKFQEHHIYQTVDEKGNVLITDDTVNKDETKGIDEDSYKTSKIDRDGYTLTEVKATNDESAKLGVKFDSKGAETTGNYVNGKKLEVTYIYQKKKVAKKGSFQEHHIYQTKKLDGSIVEDSRDDKEVKEGTEKENYKTSKIDKEGYKLIKITSENGGQFNEDGSEKEAPYIADTKQEVTYIYQKEEQKPVEKKGSFQEHHIYQTKKLDGTIVKDDEVNKDETSGTEKENYKTSKIDRDGYK
ncbi:Ig-like domain-containing protein, partial [Finegoldia magna]|uniref:Ig-like domain-containing protein n=1 Tax=Finegoldia magna TaxID=1260 RepID=UPI003F7E3CA5